MMYIWMVETKGLTLVRSCSRQRCSGHSPRPQEEIDMAFRGADSAVAKVSTLSKHSVSHS